MILGHEVPEGQVLVGWSLPCPQACAHIMACVSSGKQSFGIKSSPTQQSDAKVRTAEKRPKNARLSRAAHGLPPGGPASALLGDGRDLDLTTALPGPGWGQKPMVSPRPVGGREEEGLPDSGRQG